MCLAAAAKSLQSCPTLCNPIDGSPRGSPVPGILQARILEWVAISFSNAWKWKVKVKSLSRVGLLATPWTAAHQAPPIHGILQARVLEWGAIAFSEACALGNCKYNMHLGIPFSIHISSKLFYQVTCLSHHWILINSSLDKQFRTLHKQMYSWIFTLQFQVIK